MPALPHAVTFPGKVRIIDNGPKDPKTKKSPAVSSRTVPHPKFTHESTNRRFKNMTVTRVTVPAGFHLEYELKHTKSRGLSGKVDKPLALVKVVADGAAAPVAHAELEHTHAVTEKEIKFGYAYATEEERAAGAPARQPRMQTVENRAVVSVNAKSTLHPEIVGTGPDAASAVADMHAQIAAKKVTRTGPPEELPKPKLANLPGDEGDGEGTGATDAGAPKGELVERKG